MDAVSAFVPRQVDPAMESRPLPLSDTSRTLTVTATYLLSEEGRKASLLAGGDGRAVQQLTVPVATNRLHLVTVDANGVARLKLRPRYQLEGEQRVTRVDAFPTYDAPPSLEDLFHEAAKNHQLERSFHVERRSGRSKRQDAERERLSEIATAFLKDPAQRALVHPPPTPQRCLLASDRGRVVFEATMNESPTRDVPAEAYRRFRADLRVRKEGNQQQRSAQLALHEEKKRTAADWIARHGTTEQRERQAVGMLPLQEAIDAITDDAFAPLRDCPQYTRDGVLQLQALVRQRPGHAEAMLTRADVLAVSTNSPTATAEQFAAVKEIQRLLPESTVVLRIHKVSWKEDSRLALSPIFSVLVTQRVGPFTLRREYSL